LSAVWYIRTVVEVVQLAVAVTVGGHRSLAVFELYPADVEICKGTIIL
jgi:hypothetical protein